MMIQHVPCKQTLVCHVAVENNLYFSYTTALLYCINTVMTRVVYMSYIVVKSFDCHGPLHVLFVVEIIQLLLSSLL